MTQKQIETLTDLCTRFGIEFNPECFKPVFDLPSDWVAGWVGDRIYVGCDPEGGINS